jgi:DNA-binding transcriptional LysR family regulator
MSDRPDDWDHRIGDRLRLRELRVLLTVAATGSMAQAAARLGMTQSAVSQAIAQLEAATRVRLLDRGPKGVTPTNYGEALLRRGAEVFDTLNLGLRDIADLADPGGGEVVVGASESHVAGGFLADIIHGLARSWPRLKIRVVEANTAALSFQEVRDRSVDLMLGRIGRAPLDDDLQADHLFDESLVLVTGAQNEWAGKEGIDFADLVDRPWILSPPVNAVHTLVTESFRTRGLTMAPLTIATWSMNLRLQLLTSGPYVTAFPESLVRYNRDRWALRVLPLSLGQPLPVAIVTLKHRTQSAATRVFIEHARAAAKAFS